MTVLPPCSAERGGRFEAGVLERSSVQRGSGGACVASTFLRGAGMQAASCALMLHPCRQDISDAPMQLEFW